MNFSPARLKPLFILWIAYLALPIYLDAQTVLTNRIVDDPSSEPLPYATITTLDGSRGTLTNEDGEFAFEVDDLSDSLSISFLGYQTAFFSGRDLIDLDDIRLLPEAAQLTDVIVTADDDYLYRIIHQCRKTIRNAPVEWSRAFLQHVTKAEEQPIEMIQAYYNVSVSQKEVDHLILKNGRVAMAPLGDRYFINLGMTQAITRLDLFAKSESFNFHPLQLSLGQLRRRYELERKPSLSNAQLYHIAFRPKEENSPYFSGEIWIDKSNYFLRKVILRDNSLERHPFVSVFPDQEIKYIDLELAFTFSNAVNSQRLSHLQWQYELELQPTNRQVLGGMQRLHEQTNNHVTASGILHCYQYRDLFWEPLFEYSSEHNDYRKISFLPYNPDFWEANHGLVYSQEQLSYMAYFRDHGFLINYSEFPGEEESIFQFNNPHWASDKRIFYKYIRPQNPDGTSEIVPSAPLSFWPGEQPEDDIAVQIMVDINRLGDSVNYTSSTVLDIFETKSEPPYEDLDHCLLNMYFDLCELERRKMIAELDQAAELTYELIEEAHQSASYRIREIKRDFFSQVRGARKERMIRKWNKFIKQELDIDNMETFKIELNN